MGSSGRSSERFVITADMVTPPTGVCFPFHDSPGRLFPFFAELDLRRLLPNWNALARYVQI